MNNNKLIHKLPKLLTTVSMLSIAALLGFQSDVRAQSSGGLQTLELFTSQGCSSCPPADKLVGELRKRNNLLALTYNVNYWDRLGWKDTLASPEATERQRRYARTRGDRKVYTPQTVVNGRSHVVGSSRGNIERLIIKQREIPVIVTSQWSGDDLILNVSNTRGANLSGLRIVAVHYQPEVTVDIGAGENYGRTITYYNAVRKFGRVGSWQGDKSTKLVGFKNNINSRYKTAILLQKGEFGEIIGAVKLS